MSTVAESNVGFIDCWNTILVPKWNRFRHLLSGNGEIHSNIAYKDFGIQKGDKVVDVGCGYGETCLEIGRMVGSDGEVLGLDCTRRSWTSLIRNVTGPDYRRSVLSLAMCRNTACQKTITM